MARSLEAVVHALRGAEAYPHATTKIVVRQSHASYVFLTGEFVYKIKKPVNFGFLDYSTLARRRHFCHEEVRLNGRLSPEMYLGVVEISEADGRIVVGPGENVLEYAVKMIQLPEERMMDRLLARGRVTESMVGRLAEKLSDFYLHARTGAGVSNYGSLEVVRFNARENFSQLGPYVGRVLLPEQFEAIRAFSESFLHSNRALLEERVKQCRIRDGHGDLRAQNICFDDVIRVFDCIEFNERFRLGDVASDIAFLLTDLDGAGYHGLAEYFLRQYVRHTGDHECSQVIPYYRVYRACVRAKIECFKIDEPEIPRREKGKAAQLARAYFDLAASYVHSALELPRRKRTA